MPSASVANEGHQDHGGQETLQGPDEEVHGQKEMAGNEMLTLDWNVASPICFFKTSSFPTALPSLQKCLNLFLK